MSLALSTVIYEWRRYMAAVVALAFSGVLILAQVAMFMGMGKAFTATIDRSRADIFVLAPKADERVVEVVASADDAPLLVGQRRLVKFLKPGQPIGSANGPPAKTAAAKGA